MKIGFVFTNFNNSTFTRNLITSISLNINYHNSVILIVDNNSTIEDKINLKKLEKEYPEIIFIFSDQNVGYFKGLNIGLKYLRDNFKEIGHIVVGNNDLFFPNDFLVKMAGNIKIFEKYPVVAPDIISLEGIHQNPHVINKISNFRNLVYDIYYSNYYISIIIIKVINIFGSIFKRKDHHQHNKAQLINQGYGACYILGPIFFKKFQLLWAPTFLMGEEFFLSEQLRKEGMKVYYEPLFKVNHHDHATMGKLPSKTLWKISKDSHKIYVKYR